jgi:hypothetical protein
MDTCGFLVVRRPEANFDRGGNGIWPRCAPRVGNIYYGGVWRMPWYDIEIDRYAGTLPQTIRDAYESNVHDNEGSSIAICPQIEIAGKLLEYSNRIEQRCELICVFSHALSSIKGITRINDTQIEHYGWDPFQIGGDSLLYEGLFAEPEKFPTWVKGLNHHGLFGAAEDAQRYISDYMRLANERLIEEPLPLDGSQIDPIEVCLVNNITSRLG